MDNPSLDILQRLRLPGLHTIALKDLEAENKELIKVKKTRSKIEYYFTCTPFLPFYILNKHPDIEVITYLDADLFFFGDPAPLYYEFTGHSIAIIPHRFPLKQRSKERRGIYNVGYLSFKRNENALTCLNWWKDKCIEWCYDRVEKNRYADQKYLDEWPVRFQGVLEIQHKGANLAPWNLPNYAITKDGTTVLVDDQPLIFFHFHGFRQIASWLYDPNWAVYDVKPSQILKQSIVAPYIQALAEATRLVSTKSSLPHGIRDQAANPSLRHRIWKALDDLFCACKTILTGNYVVIINRHIL